MFSSSTGSHPWFAVPAMVFQLCQQARIERADALAFVFPVWWWSFPAVLKGWIDRELDHKMILRRDDPLVEPLRALGEPIYLLESNPTVERIAKLIYDQGRELGVDIQAVRVWETPTSVATYSSP